MKQIQMLVRFIAKVVFKKDTDEFTALIEESASGADVLQREIAAYLKNGEIDKAENHLFDCIDTGNKYHLAVAADFYARLNCLSDEELETGNFSRDEVRDGLKTVTAMFGLDFGNEFFY